MPARPTGIEARFQGILTRRIKITIAYDGTDFHGWQIQPGLPTIQGTLETIVSGIEGDLVHVAGSGRTDAGVHALAQVATFNLRNPIPLYNLRKAINRLLPPSVRVLSAEETHPDFHPRYHAIARPTNTGSTVEKQSRHSNGVTRITFPIH